MPTIDGGHVFLTLLVPVQLGEVAHSSGGVSTYSHKLREELTNLPTAAHSPVAIDTGLESPFARCTRTHFLRLVVIDQPMFNGRDPADPLLNVLKGVNPLQHQPFDVLSRSWLMLAADFDRRPDEPDNGVASWAEGLWKASEAEMRAIFSNCHGFDKVNSAPAFAAYLAQCRIETTMSFNDYWVGRPPLKGTTLKRTALLAAGVAVAVAALLWLLLRPDSMWWLLAFLLLGLAAGAATAVSALWKQGAKPFPPSPDSDLPSVLKSLHVQQRFAFFAESVQGLGPEALHNAFGHFLADVCPGDLRSPTQVPGVIRSDGVTLLKPSLDEPEVPVL